MLDDLDSGAGLAALKAVREGWLVTRAWWYYHVGAAPPPLPGCKVCVEQLPNLTTVPDPKREVMPCMRWLNRGCQEAAASTGRWEARRCQRCDATMAWGLGQYIA